MSVDEIEWTPLDSLNFELYSRGCAERGRLPAGTTTATYDCPVCSLNDERRFSQVEIGLNDRGRLRAACENGCTLHDIGAALDLPGLMASPAANRLGAHLLTTKQLLELEPPEALVGGLLFTDSVAMMHGPAGVGKSFVAADLALHVAFGSWWNGRPVKGGPVLYVVAEGGAAFGPRVNAWHRHHQLTNEVHEMRWLPVAVNLSDAAVAEALEDAVEAFRPVLVVIDTFARCAVGTDENSARDVGVIVDRIDGVRRAAGSCVLIVHHSGKDVSAGARGSSALRAAVDTELELAGDAENLTLKSTKQKNVAEAAPIRLRLRPVDGTDSVVVIPAGRRSPEVELTVKAARTLEALEKVATADGVPGNVWRDIAESDGVSRTTFYEARKILLEKGLVRNLGITDRGPYTAGQKGCDDA